MIGYDGSRLSTTVQQLILSYVRGAYTYISSAPELKRGQLRDILDGVVVRDRGLLQLRLGKRVAIVYAESGVDKVVSRGFIHRHGLVLDISEYQRLGGHPRIFDDYLLTYEAFNQKFQRSAEIEPISIPDSPYTHWLTYDEIKVVKRTNGYERLKSILNALAVQTGKVQLYYEKASFEEMRGLLFALLELLPKEIRARLSLGMDLGTGFAVQVKLAILAGSARPEIVSAPGSSRLLDELAMTPFEKYSMTRMNGKIAGLHRIFTRNFSLGSSPSESDAIKRALESSDRYIGESFNRV